MKFKTRYVAPAFTETAIVLEFDGFNYQVTYDPPTPTTLTLNQNERTLFIERLVSNGWSEENVDATDRSQAIQLADGQPC